MYIGIDYGHGKANIDVETGIRYGVISLNSCDPDWLQNFDAEYPEGLSDDDDFAEPLGFSYNKNGLICHYATDSYFLFVFKSPHIINCAFCSPCMPGAGDLDNVHVDGVKTYGLSADYLAD